MVRRDATRYKKTYSYRREEPRTAEDVCAVCNTILNGEGPPADSLGLIDDLYVDTLTMELYGPKPSDVGPWGSPIPLAAGPSGGVSLPADSIQYNGGGYFLGSSTFTFVSGNLYLTGTLANGDGSTAAGAFSHAEGLGSKTGAQDGLGVWSGGGYAHSEGESTTAYGDFSHAEGESTTTGAPDSSMVWSGGDYAHTEGETTIAWGRASHAEGVGTQTGRPDDLGDNWAGGYGAHSEGWLTVAVGQGSHAEGHRALTLGQYSHAEGYMTTASADYSHAEGQRTLATGFWSHAEGSGSLASGQFSHAEGGNTTASALGSHAEGSGSLASGQFSHAEGRLTLARGMYSHAEGYFTTGSQSYSHAEGYNTSADASYSHAEGGNTKTSGLYSHAEGINTLASNGASHAEGNATLASGQYSHAEGYLTTASNYNSHAEGYLSIAEGEGSHAEGWNAKAFGPWSHAEGSSTVASGSSSHAEGVYTIARGEASHAEGSRTVAWGSASHAEGFWTIASGSGQTVAGQYNKRRNTDSLFIIGNGSGDADTRRSDIFLVNSGSVMIGSASLAPDTFFYVGTKSPAVTTLFGGNVVVSGTFDVKDGSDASTLRVVNSKVGINVTPTTYALEVNGEFAATVKSFVIDHPNKPGWKLRHGTLEGPENGVYVRGRSKSREVSLPDYWRNLVDEESITVHITPIGTPQLVYVTSTSIDKFTVDCSQPDIEYYYNVQAERKDYTFEVEYES